MKPIKNNLCSCNFHLILLEKLGELVSLEEEIGHGKLAWRALKAVMPEYETSHTIRLVSEITESGSSLVATVCGSLSMMDAGIPLSKPVAGIAMGLIKEADCCIIRYPWRRRPSWRYGF